MKSSYVKKTNFRDYPGLLIILLLLEVSIFLPANSYTQETKGPGYYEIHSEAKFPVRIPFTMHNGKPLMHLKINGRDASLMIDNGVLWDEVWLCGTPLVDSLNT